MALFDYRTFTSKEILTKFQQNFLQQKITDWSCWEKQKTLSWNWSMLYGSSLNVTHPSRIWAFSEQFFCSIRMFLDLILFRCCFCSRGFCGMQPLFMAAMNGFYDCFKSLISIATEFNLESVDDLGRTCLHCAACGGYVGTVILPQTGKKITV